MLKRYAKLGQEYRFQSRCHDNKILKCNLLEIDCYLSLSNSGAYSDDTTRDDKATVQLPLCKNLATKTNQLNTSTPKLLQVPKFVYND
jgi:hypothetical protein